MLRQFIYEVYTDCSTTTYEQCYLMEFALEESHASRDVIVLQAPSTNKKTSVAYQQDISIKF